MQVEASSPNSWDVICIGSGISALTYAASITARNPALRMLVLEQHSVPGGYSSEFHRPKQGARFDCSLHKLTGMGDSGNLRQIFRELELENAVRLCFSPMWFDVADSPSLPISSDPNEAHRTLCHAFPDQQAGLAQFFQDVAIHGRNSYMQFQIMQGQYDPDFKALRFAHKNFKNVTVLEALRERFSDDRLVELLSVPTIYVGAFPEQCSYLYFLHVVYASLYQGSAYLAGGSQLLSNLLVEQIQRRGGSIQLNCAVKKILVNEATLSADGVETDQGVYFGRNLLINTAPLYALKHFFKSMPALDANIESISNQVPANSTTTLYLVLDCPPEEYGLRYAETLVLAHNAKQAVQERMIARASPEDAQLCELAYWERSSFEVTNYHALDAAGGFVVIVNALDDIRHWPQRKTPAYRAKKKRAAAVLLQRLGDHFPELTRHIQYCEVSSPRTYQRYTNNTAGSGYGALVSPHATAPLINNRFPLNGVRFLSAWVSGTGYEAVMGYSMMMARTESFFG